MVVGWILLPVVRAMALDATTALDWSFPLPFRVRNEYGCPEWTRKHADKIHHFWGSLACVILITFFHMRFGIAIPIVWSAAYTLYLGIIGWEYGVDCVIQKNGYSLLDIVADTLGAALGSLFLWFGGWSWHLVGIMEVTYVVR